MSTAMPCGMRHGLLALHEGTDERRQQVGMAIESMNGMRMDSSRSRP